MHIIQAHTCTYTVYKHAHMYMHLYTYTNTISPTTTHYVNTYIYFTFYEHIFKHVQRLELNRTCIIIIHCMMHIKLMSKWYNSTVLIVEKVRRSSQNYKDTHSMHCTLWSQLCLLHACFDSSHCPDSYTSWHCANFCARDLSPAFFTACTTVFQVRGKSPVPLSWISHFSTSCNIRSLSFDLFFSIPSKMADSTRKCVPNSLHWASRMWFRASITSTGQAKTCYNQPKWP